MSHHPQQVQDPSEPMDWEPAPGAALSNGGWTRRKPSSWEEDEKNDWDDFGVGRQRMFGENTETGLEGLMAGWGIETGRSAPVVNRKSKLSSIAVQQYIAIALLAARILTFSMMKALRPDLLFMGNWPHLGLLITEVTINVVYLGIAVYRMIIESALRGQLFVSAGFLLLTVLLRALILSKPASLPLFNTKIGSITPETEWILCAFLDAMPFLSSITTSP
jgi:hypothetical protein